MTTEIAIFEPQNFGTIVQAAPQAYNENKVSHERCIAYGQQLLQRVQAEGMSDALDQEVAVFIDRARKTVRKMNGKRSAVTQLFDNIRSVYTSLENEVDPAKKGTVPAMLQDYRNQYAAKKHAEFEAEQRRRQLEQAKAAAKTKYAADVEEDYKRQFNALVAKALNHLAELDKSVTIDNYDQVLVEIIKTPDQLPADWLANLRASVLLPSVISPDEARTIAADVKQNLTKRFTEQYTYEVSTSRDEIEHRLPSKRYELGRIAQANAEEAERIKQQMAERERQEAEQREKERADREAQEKEAAELAAQKQEMELLFSEAQVMSQCQGKTPVKKRINVLNPEGFMQIVGMWWAQYGSTLTVAELEKIFSKQLTFCNKLANDKSGAIFIQSEHIEYVDVIKAK
jgi:hypothetical protein